MAEGERHRKGYGHVSLRRVGSAPVAGVKHTKEKGKVEKVTGDALALCEKCANNDSSYLWANAVRRKPAPDKTLSSASSSPVRKCKDDSKDTNDDICYELKKVCADKSIVSTFKQFSDIYTYISKLYAAGFSI